MLASAYAILADIIVKVSLLASVELPDVGTLCISEVREFYVRIVTRLRS